MTEIRVHVGETWTPAGSEPFVVTWINKLWAVGVEAKRPLHARPVIYDLAKFRHFTKDEIKLTEVQQKAQELLDFMQDHHEEVMNWTP